MDCIYVCEDVDQLMFIRPEEKNGISTKLLSSSSILNIMYFPFPFSHIRLCISFGAFILSVTCPVKYHLFINCYPD